METNGIIIGEIPAAQYVLLAKLKLGTLPVMYFTAAVRVSPIAGMINVKVVEVGDNEVAGPCETYIFNTGNDHWALRFTQITTILN